MVAVLSWARCVAGSSFEDVEGESGMGDRSEGEAQEGECVVVAGDPVGPQHAAPYASVHDRPFAVAANLDGDGLHRLRARARAIAGLFVEVARPQAEWAVIAVPGAPGM